MLWRIQIVENQNDRMADEMSAEIGRDSKIVYKEESFAIQGAIFEVYRTMGCGFLEAVYQECLMKELVVRKIPFRAQVDLFLQYKGEPLIQTYKPDFICYEKIIVELKALKDVGDEHRAQVFNYLKATGYRLGLLVNFGHYPRATVERIVL
jgi:GxxExxY protein